MTEEFLQYVWKHRLFSNENLKTTKGDSIEIIKTGMWNTDSGPDFFNASIKINDTIWAGNVEVHKQSSDWLSHQHQNNEAYNNVILHVVLKNDVDISLPSGECLPAIELNVNASALQNYQSLLDEKEKPACHSSISDVDPIFIHSALNSLLIERLQLKTIIIEKTLTANNQNWNETFYQFMAINFGFKTNALPFELLARSLPLKILAHHSNNLFQLEALLFGQSGLLNEQLLGDDYYLKLREEYSYLSKKYNLKGNEGHIWKFMRLRPSNFPTIRIAQFAALIYNSEHLFSKIIEEENLKRIIKLFQLNASEYWNTHYRFNLSSKNRIKSLGELSKNILLINTVVPFLYLYGERNNKTELKNRAIQLLELLPAEENRIISNWSKLGIESTNAFDTQALIQLKNVYCDHKKCLNCQIGTKVIIR